METHRIWKGMDIKSSIIKNLDNRTLKWYEHAERMAEGRWQKKILDWYPPRKR